MAKIIQQRKENLEVHKYYMTHLSIINAFIPFDLTPKEREVLALFMSFTGKVAEANRFHTSFRKIVKRTLNLSNGGLGNYIKVFKDKEVVDEGLDGILVIKEYLFPEEKEQFYQFKITKEDE